MDATEAELVKSAKRDPAAFGELYDRYVDQIYGYVYHRVGDAVDAEDLTSRTFQRALAGLPKYRQRGAPFSAWLYRIAHNVVANWHRDRARRDTVPLESLKHVRDATDGALLRTMSSEEVGRAVRRLDPDRQQLLILKFSQGLSNAEIATVMGRSEAAIKSLYHRTLLALREEFAGAHMGDERDTRDDAGRRRGAS